MRYRDSYAGEGGHLLKTAERAERMEATELRGGTPPWRLYSAEAGESTLGAGSRRPGTFIKGGEEKRQLPWPIRAGSSWINAKDDTHTRMEAIAALQQGCSCLLL